MSVISLPSGIVIEKQSWGQRRNDVLFRSMFGSQSIEVSAPLWETTISAPTQYESTSGAWQTLVMSLKGQVNQLALYNIARPAPLGTMRGTMTLNAGAAQGATTLSIAASEQNAKTLKQGDYLGLGSGTTQQVVVVMADATSNGSGVISVTIEPPIRNAFSSGAAITWDKPCALFRRSDSKSSWDYSSNLVDGFTLSLVEDWRP